MSETKKITRTTVKSFIKKNAANLHIMTMSYFDGMIDGSRCVENREFVKASPTESMIQNTLGVAGAWFVGSGGGGGDYFQPFNDGRFSGISVSNCCRTFVLAIPA